MKRVLVSSRHDVPWYRQFPNGVPQWGDCRFAFNRSDGDYDYLVVFDDLHETTALRCPPENTIHIASEPLAVRQYPRHFTDQFGLCVTLDPQLQHPHTIYSQPANYWFLGWNEMTGSAPGAWSFESLERLFDEPRTRLISIVCSDKAFTPHHRRRLEFALGLRRHFGARLDFFGRGFVPMRDKLDALRGYRFHIALENSAFGHYFTEKFSDCVIAGCYPLYYGCSNLADYVPGESFARLDVDDLTGAIATIEKAIADDLDIHRRDSLRTARQRIMHEHNLFPVLDRIIEAHSAGVYGRTNPPAATPTLQRLKGRVREHDPFRATGQWGRNNPCPCGSGKRYKHCHGRAA